jgi:nucleoside-diphosphate-sugar epimerase
MAADYVLVTGASGFVGHAVCRQLLQVGYKVRAQHFRRSPPAGTQGVQVNLADFGNACFMLDGVAAVVHLAGMAHAPLSRLARQDVWRANVAATESIARAAATAGIRLVFVSSAKVLGDAGTFSDASPPHPPDLYAASKWEAEQALSAIPGLDFVILRPPLVYGPGVGANFLKLLKLMNAGMPLPFASVVAQRSLIGVANLADAICTCLSSTHSSKRAFLLADGEVLALHDLLRRIAAALDRPARLFPLPMTLLDSLARIAGQGAIARRLFDDFVVDDRDFRDAYDWQPRIAFAQGLQETCDWFHKQPARIAL